jgi:two-component system OmpR family sensor kinase
MCFKRFFADASHQLRTPLTSIIGFTELLMRGAINDQETMQRVLKRLKSESDRMASLINSLITLARLNDMQLKRESVDLISLSSDAIKQVRSRANDDRALSLTIATQDRFDLQADRERLKQLLFILLDNALKYGRPAPDGAVVLKLERHEQTIIIRVIDNGPGIESEDFKHIFDTFYRGRAVNSSTIIGSGLGLTIASTIVQAHNGTISANSQPGGGTEFKVVLPLAQGQI